MYKKTKEKCWACLRGVKCNNHGLKRREAALTKEEEFKGRESSQIYTRNRPLLKWFYYYFYED